MHIHENIYASKMFYLKSESNKEPSNEPAFTKKPPFLIPESLKKKERSWMRKHSAPGGNVEEESWVGTVEGIERKEGGISCASSRQVRDQQVHTRPGGTTGAGGWIENLELSLV